MSLSRKQQGYLTPLIERRIRELEKRNEEHDSSIFKKAKGRAWDDYRRDELRTLKSIFEDWQAEDEARRKPDLLRDDYNPLGEVRQAEDGT